jgi:hypothetical protein
MPSGDSRRSPQSSGAERPQRRDAKRDLRPTAFPVVRPEDWRDPEQVLSALFERAQDRALEVVDWYLADKASKRQASHLLRAAAIIFGAVGGLAPLVALALPELQLTTFGYVLLAVAGSCIAFDRFFGLSSAWMRDILGSQAVSRRLDEFQHSWAEELMRDDASAVSGVDRRLRLIYKFLEDLNGIIEAETVSWEAEFRSTVSQMREVSQSPERRTSYP